MVAWISHVPCVKKWNARLEKVHLRKK